MKRILTGIAMIATLSAATMDNATAQKKITNPDLQKYEGHWYHGPDEFYSIVAYHDTLTCSFGYVMDAGGTFYYKHRGGNKFEYLGYYDWQMKDNIHPDEDSGTIDEFIITQKDGYRYLESPRFSGPDSCMIDLAMYAGHFKGKTKSYYIDPENKNSQGFSQKRFSVHCLGDNEMEYEYCSDYIFDFGTMTLNIRAGILRDSHDKIIDILKRDFPTNAERYPFTATTLLNADNLMRSFSLSELKIMRNEIFARHGYIFKTDAMKKHFEAQTWYKGTKTNVDNLLNNIEKENIAIIKEVEQRMTE